MSYFLDSDGDGHWFVVPDEQRDAWDEYIDHGYEDPEPSWAKRLNTHPRWVVFPSYEER